jgi:RimJ/RimL family protein N-acetyltransferase
VSRPTGDGPTASTAPDVRLREVVPADLPIFFAQQADPESARMAAFASRDRDAFDAHWKKILADEALVVRTILCDGQVAGNIGHFVREGVPLVGYWLGKTFWGRGVATRALADFLPLVRPRPLYAHVAKHNRGSIRVLEKCGFTVAGEERGEPMPDGTVIDDLIMKLEAAVAAPR